MQCNQDWFESEVRQQEETPAKRAPQERTPMRQNPAKQSPRKRTMEKDTLDRSIAATLLRPHELLRLHGLRLLLGFSLAFAMAFAAAAPAAAQQTSKELNQLQTRVNQRIANDTALEGAQIVATLDSHRQITLNGSVENETQWQKAENLALNTAGVRTVVNNLIITGPPNAGADTAAPTGSAAYTGTRQAESAGAYTTEQSPANTTADSSHLDAASTTAIAQGEIPPPPPADSTNNAQAASTTGTNQNVSQSGQSLNYQGEYDQGQNYQNQYSQNQTSNSSQGGYYDTNGSPNQGYRSDYVPPSGYTNNTQQNSGPVMVPSNSLMQVRLVETLDSKHLIVGESFDATQANDVFVGNVLAIPRGAQLTGEVVDLKKSGSLGGHTLLALRLTGLTLGGQYYPLSSSVWWNQGPSKAGYTASNTVTGSALGAVIGAIAGGGVGAAAGAVAGAAGGMGVSAATTGSRIILPSESLLVFRLTQPVTVQPVSAYEAQRLSSGSPQLQRRTILREYPQPVYAYPAGYPPPFYYGPGASMGWGWGW